MLTTAIIDPLRDRRWDAWVQAHPAATLFHTSAWGRVLATVYRHKPVYLAILRDGEPAVLTPCMDVRSPLTGARGVCLPFSDACGPLHFGDEVPPETMDEWWQLARERRWKYVEIRSSARFGRVGSPVASYHGHSLDLRPGMKAVSNGFKSSLKGALKKAERSGVTLEVSRDRAALLAYYQLHLQTRRKHGVPAQSLAFFEAIQNEVINPGNGFVVTAKREGISIAASVFFHFGTRAIYKFAASDARYRELSAGNLVLWGGIKGVAEAGAELIDFGRTSTDNEGLRRFKLSWGAAEESVDYWRWDANGNPLPPAAPGTSRLQHAMFRRLPPGVDRWAGAVIYPHLD